VYTDTKNINIFVKSTRSSLQSKPKMYENKSYNLQVTTYPVSYIFQSSLLHSVYYDVWLYKYFEIITIYVEEYTQAIQYSIMLYKIIVFVFRSLNISKIILINILLVKLNIHWNN